MADRHGPPDAITVSSWYDGAGNFGKVSDYFAFPEEYLLATPERKAAGELLAACEELVEEIEYGDRLVYDDQRAVLARVKAAIAAATPDTD